MAENRTYSEADLTAKRREWEQAREQTDLTRQVAQIQGQLLTLPQAMESVARRVVAEVIADQHKLNAQQRDERTWGRAPVVMQALQLIAWLAVAAGAYVAGKGHIP